jgi:phage baseplate assembly protein W
MNGIGFYDQDFFIIKSNKDLISESIRRILMTGKGERVGRPFFGVGLKKRLFDQMDQISVENIKQDIQQQIETFEPRVNITYINVDINYDEQMININLKFKIKSEREENELNLSFDLEN